MTFLSRLQTRVERLDVRRAICIALFLLVIAIGAAPLAIGQARNSGTIAGNVMDVQGSAVTTAVVTLASVDQGRTVTVKANTKGEYLLTDVPVGTYNLTVTAPTFQTYVVDSIAVDAEQNVRIDAHLQNGDAAESVTVEAGGTTLDTRSATIGAVIENKLVEELPIDGENVVSLAALLPGVVDVNAPATFTSDTGGPTFTVSGSRANQNLFLLDGFLWNNSFYNTGLNFPPPRSMNEVSVQLNNFKAQYGRNAGSVFNAITKSGTNQLHGTLWEYLQNSAFDATDWITQFNPHLVSNQFGATLGGPIRKDKAFFFLTFQDLRYAGQAVAEDLMPSYAERGLVAPGVALPCTSSYFSGMTCANFSAQFAANAGVNYNQVVQNPLYSSTYAASATTELNSSYQQQGGTGTSPCVTLMAAYMATNNATTTKRYLPNAEIPSVCFNPVAVNFLNKYAPVPNLVTKPLQALSTAKQPRNDYNGMARADLNLGHHIVEIHFYMTSVNDITSNSVSAGTGVADYELDQNTGGIAFGGIGDTWIISPNIVNIFRAGYKRYKYQIDPTDPTTLQTLGSAVVVPGKPALPELEATNQFTLGSSNSGLSYTLNANYEANDSFSWTKGNHNLQFGAQYLELQYVHRYDQVPFIESEQQNTETSLGDFLLGLTYQETFGNSTNISAQQHVFYFYGQDDWRATSRLTVNYGIRYELPFQWYQPNGQSLTFIAGYQSTIFPTAPPNMAYAGDPGISKSIVPTRFNDFAPRVGFAYDVFGSGKTSIRGGFGIFFDAINANIVGIGEPYHYSATYSQPPGSFSNPLLGQSTVPTNYVKGSPQFAGPYTVNFADHNLTTPYTEAVNFGIQQRLRKSATIEVNYVGRFGRHQIIQFDLNQAIYDCSGGYFLSNPAIYCADANTSQSSYQSRVRYPGYNYGGQGVVDNASIGTSNYNGLQVIYTQRSRKSLSGMASYTYSRSLDLQSNGQTNSARVPMPYNLHSQYGPSDFQATQIVNVGFTWNLPEVQGRSHFVRAITNGWRLSSIFNARTGHPINVHLAGDLSLTDDRPQRPLAVPGVDPARTYSRSRTDKVAGWFNNAIAINPTTNLPDVTLCAPPAAFCDPPTGTFGNVGRNSLYGPAFIVLNGSVGRFFPLSRGKDLEFKVDAFNLLNQPNFANPNSQLTATTSAQSSYGSIQSTVGTNGVVGTNGRRLQLSLLLRF